MRHGLAFPALGIAIAFILGGCAATSGAETTNPGSTMQPSDAPGVSAVGSAGPLEPSARPAAASTEPLSDELPTRIVMSGLRIDLPVVSGDLAVAGNPPDYPLCDVAQFLTTYRYPGRLGATTWIYGHARQGMLLPLLEASEPRGGRALIGAKIRLYTDADRRYTFRVTKVLRHATDRSSAARVPPDGRRLVLQTSEGPKGTVPKLQVVAELVDIAPATAADSEPKARPRGCYSA